MRIRYENSIEDLVAFTNYHYENSPSMWRFMAVMKWFTMAVIAFPLLGIDRSDSWAFWTAIGIAAIGLLGCLLPATYLIRKSWLTWVLGPLVGVGFILVASGAAEPYWPMSLAILVPLIFLFPAAMKPLIGLQVRALFKEGSSKGTLGPRELELTGTELIERTPYGESKVRLETIERVVSNSDYTFVYLNAYMGHAIPHHAVVEGDREAFVAALTERIAPSGMNAFRRAEGS
jgi:hypothetical protein